MYLILSQAVILQRKLESLNKNPLSYFEKADLICISSTQIYHNYNLPMQSLNESELTYTKEKFRKTVNLTKILGVLCEKTRDNMFVFVPEFK